MFYAGLAILAAVMATLYLEIGPFALVVFAVPILLARETLRQTSLAASASRDLAARREALRLVDERIAQERADERNRIAAALHDEVLQRIFDVTLRAHVIRECYRRGQLLELEAAVPELIDSAERAAQEARDVIHGLRRSPVGHAGLIETLSLLIAHIADESGVKIVSELVEEPRLQPNVELAIYQIAREALVNSSKHSHADTIWLALKRQRAGVELSVLDNGIGFDVTQRKAKHFGLEVMSERADAAGGSLAIQSSPGNGVLIVATFEGA
jgi:NarL family two-component system sensor histidine kinase LiaS